MTHPPAPPATRSPRSGTGSPRSSTGAAYHPSPSPHPRADVPGFVHHPHHNGVEQL
ncbi:hypothetical protein F750_0661 [Streptomyces sp. PAMC 26508]|nr:hypothetical protein F750_0661 [Streptomyces sp. PAMC 26508]